MTEIISSENTVSSDVEITGSLKFKGRLSFGGQLKKGSIAGETLIVASTGSIKGNITTDSLRMDGKVEGDVMAMKKCDLGRSAVLIGDVTSPSLAMADGATLVGQMQIGPTADQLKPKALLVQ
jgi:cytoskeletal protein CcmA (bactofilin family)